MTTLAKNLIRQASLRARKSAGLSATLLCFILQTNSLHATINVVSYWRLGENDPGGAPGVAVTNTIDSAGTNNLTFQGNARYTNDVAAAAAADTSSTLSINFTNGAYATNGIVSTNQDNFGIECWVKPNQTSSNQVIAYNGSTGGIGDGGWGTILATDNNFYGLFGGVTTLGGVPATANVWTHLALVRDSGVATLYVNGVAAGTTTGAMPRAPAAGGFALAAPPQSPTSQFFTGLLDEVRVFTFAPGQFSTSDLLVDKNASFTLSATNLTEGPGSGAVSVHLNVMPPGLSWSVSTNAPWLHLTNSTGSGDANVTFTFDANSGATRVGTLTIAGQTLTVTQAGSGYVPVAGTTTLVSGGPYPQGVAVDSAGNVYIADSLNNTVTKWNVSDQTLTSLVASGLYGPDGVAVDGAGNVYIADSGNNAIKEWIAASNTVITLVSSGLNSPHGVAVDSTGNVYIADEQNSAIKEWIAASNTVVPLVSSGLNIPFSVALDAAGNVYIADSLNNAIKEWIAASNTVITLVSNGLNFPQGVAVDGVGNVYIDDYENNAVKEWIAASNTVTTLVSGLNFPTGVAVDGSGSVYIADSGNDAVKELPRAFLNPAPITLSGLAGYGSLPVLPASVNLSGVFQPTSDQSWFTITYVSGGVVSYNYSANTPTTSRTAHVSLLGQQITITQLATFILGVNNLVEGPSAGQDAVQIITGPGVVWTVSSGAGWLHPLVSSGIGRAWISFNFDANNGPPRGGNVTIGGQIVNITQAGTNYVAATSPTLSIGGGNIYGVAVDGVGNVFFTDAQYNEVEQLLNPYFSAVPVVSGLNSPQGLALDIEGNIYIADNGSATIREWEPASLTLTNIGTVGQNPASDVAVDITGNIYIAGNTFVEQWNPGAQQFFRAPFGGVSEPAGLAVDLAGNVYFSSQLNDAVNKENTTLFSGLVSPTGVAVDGVGNVYVADTGNQTVNKWNVSNGQITQIFPGLASPTGVAVDGTGNIYVAAGVLYELARAYSDSTPRFESGFAGGDSLSPVVTVTTNVLLNLYAISDQPWLTIVRINGAAVVFSFTANATGSSRTAHISMLDNTISVTQSSLPVPIILGGPALAGNGNIQFAFTNNQLSNFTVLSTTNLAVPLSNWTALGAPANISPGIYQFTTPATNGPERFYRVRSP